MVVIRLDLLDAPCLASAPASTPSARPSPAACHPSGGKMRLERATLQNLQVVLFLGWAAAGVAAAQESKEKEPKAPKAPDQAAPAEKADKPVSLIEEVTVTAQKREEDIQDVPVTMQAF